jgi:Trm5-related predicted tRNA methylase
LLVAEEEKINEVQDPNRPRPMTEKEKKQKFLEDSKNGVPIIVDCSFQNLLTEKELSSLCRQIGYCHSANKKAAQPAKMVISSYKDQVKTRLDANGAQYWGCQLLEENYLAQYPNTQLVYLSGDAEKTMETFDPT